MSGRNGHHKRSCTLSYKKMAAACGEDAVYAAAASMPSCIVRSCTFKWRHRDPAIILHCFPSNPGIIRSWLLQTRQDFGNLDEMCHRILASSKGQYRICSQHFSPDCYYQNGMQLALKKEALPTIFPDEAAIAETARRKRRRRRKGDPSAPGTGDGGGAPPSAELPLTVVSVEQEELPLLEQEPVTLISEDGYYMSVESFIQKRSQLSGPRRDVFPLKRRRPGGSMEPLPGQRATPTLPEPRLQL